MKKVQRIAIASVLAATTLFTASITASAVETGQDVFGVNSASSSSAYQQMKQILIDNYGSSGLSSLAYSLMSFSQYNLFVPNMTSNAVSNGTISTKITVADKGGSSTTGSDVTKIQDPKHVFESTTNAAFGMPSGEQMVNYYIDHTQYTVYPSDKYVQTFDLPDSQMPIVKTPDSFNKYMNSMIDGIANDSVRNSATILPDGTLSIQLDQSNIPDSIKYGYQSSVEISYAQMQAANEMNSNMVGSMAMSGNMGPSSTVTLMEQDSASFLYPDYSALQQFKTSQVTNLALTFKQNDAGKLTDTHLSLTVNGVDYTNKTVVRTLTMDKTVTNIGTTKVSVPNLNGVKVLDFSGNSFQKLDNFATGTATFTYNGKTVKVKAKDVGNSKLSAYYQATSMFGDMQVSLGSLKAKFPDGKDIWIIKTNKNAPASNIFTLTK